MEELDKSNLLISTILLKDASDLLKNDEPEISLSLLKLSKAIIVRNNLLSSDIEYSDKLIKTISDEK